jgi:hypothetical protein
VVCRVFAARPEGDVYQRPGQDVPYTRVVRVRACLRLDDRPVVEPVLAEGSKG